MTLKSSKNSVVFFYLNFCTKGKYFTTKICYIEFWGLMSNETNFVHNFVFFLGGISAFVQKSYFERNMKREFWGFKK